MDFRLRMFLWIPALTYVAFLLSGGSNRASLGQIATLVFLGAGVGFLLAATFTIRQRRREKQDGRTLMPGE